ncbi:TIR domain-containing protein [Lachnospiraceae bacterium 29-91]
MNNEWNEDYNEYTKIIYESLYLHFFNREIYRGIYGEKVDNLCLDMSNILSTILICGCNQLYASFSAFYETRDILLDKGESFRKLYDNKIIIVSAETLNIDENIGIKQNIYSYDKTRYSAYFDNLKELEMIVPSLPKPDVTDEIEKYFQNDSWEDTLLYAPSLYDKRVLQYHEGDIRKRILHREKRAITKSLFKDMFVEQRLPECIGRTLSGMYVKNYMEFLLSDIVTGIDRLQEYDKLSKNFPYHDYHILTILLSLLGFPKRFQASEFEQILKLYESEEHRVFALKVQEILHLLFKEEKNQIFTQDIQRKRVRYIPILKGVLSNLSVKKIDFTSINYYEQCIENIDCAIQVIKKRDKRKRGKKAMSNNKVFVVTGRNDALRLSIFNLLRALKLNPMEWMEVIENAEEPSPYISTAIKKSIDEAAAVIIIMAPEEEAKLIEELQTETNDDQLFKQPRPNVIFEAGLALGLKESKTIILQFGEMRIFSDILGKHILRYRGEEKEVNFKNDLVRKLRIAGCECEDGNDYYDPKNRIII